MLKALTLGAKGVLAGRAALQGLAAGGEAGVILALELLREKFPRVMAMRGARSVK